MTRYTFEILAEWVLPRLPKRFQEGRLPYIFFVLWLLIGVMLLLAFIVPYPGGVPVPLIFAFVLLVLQLLFIWGVPFYICAYIGLFTAITLICYTSWMSGGYFFAAHGLAYRDSAHRVLCRQSAVGFVLFWLGVVSRVRHVIHYLARLVIHPSDFGLCTNHIGIC